MALQTINIGASANDGSGDPLRTAMDKINDNFAVLDTGFNVKDLDFEGGAVGDGVTDDTAAVTAAWNAAKAAAVATGRSKLYFPVGKYKIATSSGNPYFNLAAGMTVEGEGMYASEIYWVDTNSGSTLSLIGGLATGRASNTALRDFAIRGNHDADDTQVGSYPLLINHLDNPIVERMQVYYSRTMGIVARDCFAPDINNCYVGIDHRVGHFRPLRIMAQIIEHLNLSIVRCFSIAQKQIGVADAMIEAVTSTIARAMASTGRTVALRRSRITA